MKVVVVFKVSWRMKSQLRRTHYPRDKKGNYLCRTWYSYIVYCMITIHWREKLVPQKRNQKNQGQQKTKKLSRIRSKHLWLWAGLALFIILGVWAYFYYQTPTTLSATSTPAQIALGEQLYSENCLSCHGAKATVENPVQSRGGQKDEGSYLAPALNGKGHAWHHPNEMLYSIVKDGSIAKDSPMQGFKDKLSDEDIVAVLQYVKSLWPDEIQVRHAIRP